MVGEDLARDRIPLDEISAVEFMSEREDLNSLLSRVGGSGDVQNFGRTSMDHSSTPQTPTRWLKYSFSGHELSEEETLQSRSFQIRPRPDGFNSGRLYYLRAENNIECERFMSEIKALIKEAQKQVQEATRFSWIQHCAKQVYDSQIFQGISMLLIVAVIEINFFCALCLLNCGTIFSFQNFALSIAASQANIANQPYPGPGSFWSQADMFLIAAFTAELIINCVANWWLPFITNPWSLLDAAMVALSLATLAPLSLSLRLVLLLRCCRVLRIFARLPSVAKIFRALSRSVIPLANAFFIIFVVVSICERSSRDMCHITIHLLLLESRAMN